MAGIINPYRFAAAGGGGGFGSHIGWRIYSMSNMAGGTSNRTSAGEIQFKDSGGNIVSTSGATIFEGGTGTASAPASNAFDGSLAGNPWSRTSTNGGNGCYIGAIWGTPQAVTQFTMYSPPGSWGGNDTEPIMSGKLQYSDDSTTGLDGTWTDAFTFWEPSWVTGTQVSRTHPQTFATGQYKAFQLYATESNDGSHMAVDEIQFRATVGGADLTDNTTGHYYNTANSTNGANAFDNNTSTYSSWGSGSRTPMGFGFAFATPTSVAEYAVTKMVFVTEAVRDWTLRATTDGTNFTTLDTQTMQSFTGGQTKTYSI